MSRHSSRALLVVLLLASFRWVSTCAAEPDLVDIRAVDPTIVIDLRYASTRNITKRPLYPTNMPALVRAPVAAQLSEAQTILRARGFRLKIWDAYRPKSAHDQLWQHSLNTDYVADPTVGGSLHTCGVAVDATMVDSKGREAAMPTDFDDFTPAAMLQYTGDNFTIRRNLRILQNAMARAGFYGLRTEWWHFVTKEWKGYSPVPEITILPATDVKAAARPTGATSPTRSQSR